MTKPSVVFFGGAGQAKTIAGLQATSLPGSPFVEIVAFVDDFVGDRGSEIDGRPVISFETWLANYRRFPAFVAIGEGSGRRIVVEKLAAYDVAYRGIYDAPTGGTSYGEGTAVLGRTWIEHDVRIGRHCHVSPHVFIGAHTTVGDFATLCPGARIAPNTIIGDDVFVGAAVTIARGDRARITIGNGVRLYAGSVVTQDVPDGGAVAGNPGYDPRISARRSRT